MQVGCPDQDVPRMPREHRRVVSFLGAISVGGRRWAIRFAFRALTLACFPPACGVAKTRRGLSMIFMQEKLQGTRLPMSITLQT